MNSTPAQTKARQLHQGPRTVTPHLVCAGAAAAIEFYKNAFGAVEVMRIPGPDGKLMHAHISIGDSSVFLVDEMPQWNALGPKALGNTPVTMHLYVDDADASFARAVAAGAVVAQPLADMFWGDRYGSLIDPFGHHWAVATHLRDLSAEEIQQAMKKGMPG